MKKLSVRLNTLSGGHPLRTCTARATRSPWASSQYPLRWAPSSDGSAICWLLLVAVSQYPLRWAPSSDPAH